MASQGERLRYAMKLAGYKKVAAFAEVCGVEAGTMRQQIDRDSIPKDAAGLYVRKLRRVGLTLDWLLFGRGIAPGETPAPIVRPAAVAGSSVELTHIVGAGDEVFPIPGDGHGYIQAPPGFENGGAVGIRGESGKPLFDDKDVLFYRHWEPPPTSKRMPDRPVIIELADGRSFLKKLLPGSKKGRYHLMSINPASPPIIDVELKQFARIGWVCFGGMVDLE